MVRYIKSNEEPDILEYEVHIDLVYQMIGSGEIAASIDTNLTGQALCDYEDFIITAIDIIECCGFKYIDADESDRDGSKSEYYTFVKKDTVSGKTIKCIVFFRISDHPLNESKDKRARRTHHYNNEARGNSQYDKVLYDGYSWKLISINIDDKSYSTYRDAEHALKVKMDNLTFENNIHLYKK